MHLTDDQLNEYLDNETGERAQIESHLSSCDECAARLTSLKTLFTEIESLPELELTRSFAARFTPALSLTPKLPPFLTLTATLQAALALITLIVAAPFVTNLLPAVEMPSFAKILILLQTQWITWLETLSTLQFPSVPQITMPELSSLVYTLTLAGVSLLWLVGNGLLLRKQTK
jgi:hypothetical protein